jgi:hypothetical protein
MTRSLTLAVFAIIGTFTASAVGPVMADASMADALAGRFIADGEVTIFPAVGPTQGSAPPSYNYKGAMPDHANVLDIAHKLAPPASLYAHLTGVWDHVMGGEFEGSHVSEGDTSIATAALMLNLDPIASPAGSVRSLSARPGCTPARATVSCGGQRSSAAQPASTS